MNILVTGGAGYIGSIVVEECIASGHTAVVLDDLSKGHREMVHEDAEFFEINIGNKYLVKQTLSAYKIDAVIHMAASSLVAESMTDPAAYYKNNVVCTLELLDAMIEARVKKLVFSSTAAVYGEAMTQRIKETDQLAPTNAYGETKLTIERALRWYDVAYGLRYASLRYFNAAGASDRCGELHEPETHLIPIILQVAAGVRPLVNVYGDDYPTPDGTCIRDYIHVRDLARAHVMAVSQLDKESAVFNLGCGGNGYSVNEVIESAARVTGRNIPVVIAERRPGDPPTLIASSEKIKRVLGWEPQFQDLDTIIQSAWRWMTAQRARSDYGASDDVPAACKH